MLVGYCGVLEGAIHAAHGKDTDLSATTMGEVSVRPYLCRGMDVAVWLTLRCCVLDPKQNVMLHVSRCMLSATRHVACCMARRAAAGPCLQGLHGGHDSGGTADGTTVLAAQPAQAARVRACVRVGVCERVCVRACMRACMRV